MPWYEQSQWTHQTPERKIYPTPQNCKKTGQHKLGRRQKYLKTTLHWVCSLCFGKQFAITGHLQWHNPKSLDQVESQTLHFISGGMRSTPTTACGIDVDIEPLGLRREGAVIEMVERYKRSDQDNPNRKIVEEWKQDHRIQQNSKLQNLSFNWVCQIF